MHCMLCLQGFGLKDVTTARGWLAQTAGQISQGQAWQRHPHSSPDQPSPVPPSTHLQHPLGQRDLRIVAHVAAAGMEAHHDLELQAQGAHQRKQLAVARPVVPPRPPLHSAPLRQESKAGSQAGQGRQGRQEE